MSVDGILSGVQSITTTISTGGNVVARVGSDIAGFSSAQPGSWKNGLKQASYRGVPFGTFGGESQFGRRNIVHEYPYRDKPWVEDLGRSSRVFTVEGFLVGDDVIAQRDRMIAAAESEKEGAILQHPTYGLLKVNMVSPLSISEAWDEGRVFRLRFTFIESGERLFPTVETDSGADVDASFQAANAAMSDDFFKKVGASLKYGAAVVEMAASKAATWGRTAQRLSNDASNLVNMVGSLKGSYGRYFGGRNINGMKAASNVSSAAKSVSGLIAAGTVARAAVTSAISDMSATSTNLGSS